MKEPVFFLEDIFNRLHFRWILALSILLSIFFTFLYFNKLIFSPTLFSFAQEGDDFKNYFTLLTYLNQPASSGYFHYSYMNYPYGETIYFTDNSPIIAIFLKWLKNSFGFNAHTLVYFFDLFIISNYVLSSAILVCILKRFVSSNLTIVAMAISLPFANPQAIRIFAGTENLSLSWILLLSILLVFKVVESANISVFKLATNSVLLIVCIVACSFIHLYYLLLILMFVAPLLFFLGIKRFMQTKQWDLILVSIIVSVFSFISVQAILLLTDPFYSLRKDGANGFGWEPWKLGFGSLFTSYEWSASKFLFSVNKIYSYESLCYLGPVVLYGALLLLIACLIHNNSKTFKLYFEKFSKSEKFVFYLFAASLISLFMSLGFDYHFGDNQYTFNNYFNVSRIIGLFSKKIAHFRCLGRFSWIFYWASQFLVVLLISRLLKARVKWVVLPFYILLYFNIADGITTAERSRAVIHPNPFLLQNSAEDVKMIVSKVNKKYDAILFLPFFQTGSEDYPKTIDPTPQVQKTSMTLSHLLKSPTFSFLMSRTPLVFNDAQLQFYSNAKFDSLSPLYKKSQRILIIKNLGYYNDIQSVSNNCSDSTKNIFENSKDLPLRLGAIPLYKVGENELFEWNYLPNETQK